MNEQDHEKSPMSFTGVRRQRKTRPAVLMVDRVARTLITVGGLGTILSVLGVAVFLVWVVMPLFLPSQVDEFQGVDLARADLLHVGLDEYQVLGWMLLPSGEVEVFRLDTGEVRWRQRLFETGELTASSFLIRGDTAAFGLSDGSLQLAEIGFKTRIVDELPPAVAAICDAGEIADFENGVVQSTPAGQYRVQQLEIELAERTRISTGPILELTHTVRPDGPLMVALVQGSEPPSDPASEADAAGEVQAAEPQTAELPEADLQATGKETEVHTEVRLLALAVETEEDFMTGEKSLSIGEARVLPYDSAVDDPPMQLAITAAATEVYLAWADGRLERIQIRDLTDPWLAESGRLAEVEEMTFFQPILGGSTFLWGDQAGRLRGGFGVRMADAEGALQTLQSVQRDPRATFAFSQTKALAKASSPVSTMASSARSRLAAAGFANGEIRLFNITNATQVASVNLPVAEPILALRMAPKEDGLLAVTAQSVFHAHMDPRFPEAGFSAFFRPVWYEGYANEQHTWQSSSGTDDFEMKLGLMPLVFGTLKATFYSMLFGAPLALLAALFTSEFLSAGLRSVIKPGIELMASLPSVVLGFLAALVIAPFIEKVVPATLAAFFTVPATFLLGAYLWQMLPVERSVRWQKARFFLMAWCIPLGVLFAAWVGPWVESLLFSGDFKGWLSWQESTGRAELLGSPLGGWFLLWLPLAATLVVLALGRLTAPLFRDRAGTWGRRQLAIADFGRFGVGLLATMGLAWLLAWLCAVLGFDPRGSLVDTYVQRNAMIVGFVMGFAIIPIIYTLAEDALRAVPGHLRSASLGAGATTWQTAIRIVMPTAMSGLFSALMVGLGRAVGETMIVLMAAGNTPVMEWNIFEGFRTLSANIAVELPEAVQGSTHYRSLFLAALVLFIITFVVNTIAEVIRQRFRKRAYQL